LKKLRLIVDEGHDVYWNMAFDEAMLELRIKKIIPETLRLYTFKPSAITVGYFQKIEDSINLKEALNLKIDFTRRFTGGGAVYHDARGEITYSLVLDVGKSYADIEESYRRICMGIVYALELLGLKGYFQPVNDVLVCGRKISGSAQARRGNVLLQHGTLMYGTDIDILSKVLIVPREKLKTHAIKSLKERVTTISQELKGQVSREEVLIVLTEGFRKALNVEFTIDKPTPEELNLTKQLMCKYRSREWIFKR